MHFLAMHVYSIIPECPFPQYQPGRIFAGTQLKSLLNFISQYRPTRIYLKFLKYTWNGACWEKKSLWLIDRPFEHDP